MTKKVNVLEAQDFKERGMFFYCTSSDIQSRNKDEIMDWFGNAKKITLEKEQAIEFKIASIDPMISFTDNAAVMIKIDAKSIPVGVYPTTAIIE